MASLGRRHSNMATTISYSDFFAKREDLNSGVDFEDKGSFYLCEMEDGNKINRCEVAKNGGAEHLEFESRYMPRCNKVVKSQTVNINSHDFSDNTYWIPKVLSSGAIVNSVFTMVANAGKKLVLKHLQLAFSDELSIAPGQSVKGVLWESITEDCPAPTYVSHTAYNNDGSWALEYPPPIYLGQEVAVYVKYSGATPLYKVTEFTYSNTNDILKKARPKEHMLVEKGVSSNKYQHVAYFMYQEEDIYIALRGSKGERFEFFTSDNNVLNNNSTGVPSVVVGVFDVYDEW